MKNFFRYSILALALIVVSMPALAQKNPAPSKEKKVFYGQIDYVLGGREKPQAEAPKAKPVPHSSSQKTLLNARPQGPEQSPFVLRMFSDPKMVTVDQNTARASLGPDDRILKVFVMRQEVAMLGELPIEKLYQFNESAIRKISDALAQKDHATAQKLMDGLYKRTDEQKQICDFKCVKYIVSFGQLKGEAIWVCEDFVLPHFMTPFWGMIFPVFEAEFCLPFEPLKPFHVQAERVNLSQPEAQKNAILNKNVEPVAFEDILRQFNADPARFIN